MHYHLDALGGVSGDMFVAAMLDCHADWEAPLLQALALAPTGGQVSIRAYEFRDHVLTGRRFDVRTVTPADRHGHRPYREIRRQLSASALAPEVVRRAIAIFDLLAQAESRVHGVAVDDVAFHEVGAWDSVADIVAAAWLIDRARSASWSVGPLPTGSGRVDTAHGQLPLPAPATARLLEGFALMDDGVPGERITPTGAAVLRHLQPHFGSRSTAMRLAGTGTGFGSRTLPGLSNILRILRYEALETSQDEQRILVCEFEVDDQTPEDLAVGLDKLRETAGVLDVIQVPVFGKKGRLSVHVRVLAEPSRRTQVLDGCLLQTTTLGVRWTMADRKVLAREQVTVESDQRTIAVKLSHRPDDSITAKAEMDDLKAVPGGFAARAAVRESAQFEGKRKSCDGDGVDS